MSTPVYEEWFGKYFVVPHLAVVSGFLFLFISLIVLNKTGYLKSPQYLYIEQEKKAFETRYNLKFEEKISKTKRNMALTAAILSTFLPAALPMIAVNFFGVKDHTFITGIGIVLMFIGFYKSIGYLMSKSQLLVKDILKSINDLDDDTNLVTTDYGMNNTPLTAAFDMIYEGKYKGRKVHIDYVVSGFHTGRTVKVNSRSTVAMATTSTHTFTLTERDMKWKKYEFRSTDDCFTKRFKYESPSGYYLSTASKEIFNQYNRLWNIRLEDGQLVYDIENPEVLPYYSIEGMILFLDYLTSIADAIETHPN